MELLAASCSDFSKNWAYPNKFLIGIGKNCDARYGFPIGTTDNGV